MVSGWVDFFRRVVLRACELRLQPVSDLTCGESGTVEWRATGEAPRFMLDPQIGQLPYGWVLIESRITCSFGDHSTRLLLDLGMGFKEECALDVPVTFTGTIHELVFLPRGLIAMQWAPMHSPGAFTQSPFSLRRVGLLERIFRMLRRVVPVLWRESSLKLESLGLSFSRMLFDLEGAYAAAGKLRAHAPAPSYPQWIRNSDTLSEKDRSLIERHIRCFASSPRFVLLVAAPERDDDSIARTLDSIRNQMYGNVKLCILTRGQFCSYSAQEEGDAYLAIIRAGDVLSEHALYWMASLITRYPSAVLLYSDEDRLEANGTRCEPKFKPDWSPELLRSCNYIGGLAVFRADQLGRAGGLRPEDVFGDGHDLALRITEGLEEERVVHVPAILIHCGSSASEAASGSAVEAHLSRMGVPAQVDNIRDGVYRVQYALPQDTPMLSILIPTRDALKLLRRCVFSILQKSSYSNYEVILINNQSVERDTLDYFAEIGADARVRVLHYDAPFNYSAINNFASAQARGDVLCLLNNDTEVISPDWMEEMLGHLLQPRVGIVGAKLLYPDGRVQHGGDFVGVGGVANHAHAFLLRSDSGYCNRAVVAQDMSAVTGACMMTWRRLYVELGGLQEQHLKVAFNDVDYCLRVREKGYRVVWTPHAELYHHESVSRGKDDTPEKRARARKEAKYMRKRWGQVMECDPFYNPNLSYQRADFSLSHAPLVRRPWLTRR